MNPQELDRRVMQLIQSEKFDIAEHELEGIRSRLFDSAERNALDHVLSLLVTVNLRKEPRDLAKAESYCLELEQSAGTGYAKLQYAMMLYWSMDDSSRAVTKAQEAVSKGREEQDHKTVYQSLSVLGLALLDLHQYDRAQMVLERSAQWSQSV